MNELRLKMGSDMSVDTRKLQQRTCRNLFGTRLKWQSLATLSCLYFRIFTNNYLTIIRNLSYYSTIIDSLILLIKNSGHFKHFSKKISILNVLPIEIGNNLWYNFYLLLKCTDCKNECFRSRWATFSNSHFNFSNRYIN